MNAARRKELKKALELLREAQDLLVQASDMIEEIKSEEEESFDNLPECLQESERGEHMQECIDNLDEIYYMINEVDFESIESMVEDM